MAIKFTESQPSTKGYGDEVVRTWTTHEGLVTKATWSRVERVQSDIYADCYYCQVWNPETMTTETVALGSNFDLCMTRGTATVDASPEILAEVAQQVAEAKTKQQAEQQARWAREAAERAEREANRPVQGKVMKVVRGRKVAQGTVGTVFWMRDGRVGLALDDSKDARGRHVNVAWVDADYLVAA